MTQAGTPAPTATEAPQPGEAAAAPLPTDAAGALWDALIVGGSLLLIIAAVLLAHQFAYRIVLAIAKRTPRLDEAHVRRMKLPSQIAAAALAALFILPKLHVSAGMREGLRHAMSLALILAITILGARLISLAVQAYLKSFDISVADNLRARRMHTQATVVARIATVVVWVIGIAAALMTFPSVRHVGMSILASAGIAGLVLGLAAQRVLGNFLAGMQIAMTEPINLDDVVIIEGEWGRIEEITATFVVVRIWDQRRLVVPFSHFLEKPFQNWTRRSAEVLGTVFLWTDYTVPVARLREEVERIAKASDKWDGRVAAIQITDCTERAVQVRVLVSAADASKAWDLRCEMREKMIDFIQREFPQSLPRLRAEVATEAAPERAA